MRKRKKIAWILSMAVLTGCLGCGVKESESASGQSQAPSPQVWVAAANGDLAALKEALKKGMDVNAREPMGGGTLLLTACFAGEMEIARHLIDYGADIELANKDGSTPLMTAVFMCHTDTVRLLLDQGAQVNRTNNQGQTPLDVVGSAWTSELEEVYKFVGQILQTPIDLDRIKSTRGSVAEVLRDNGGKMSAQL